MPHNRTTDPSHDLEDRVAIVTGASRGIGRAVAIALAAQGMKVACAARSTEALRHTVNACQAIGGTAISVTVDLTSQEAIRGLVATVQEELGPISTLVHNAGVMHRAAIGDISMDELSQTFAVNVEALFALTHLATPDLIETEGAVITIASVAGKMGFARGAAYAASKHAAVGFSACVFEDLREHGVKVSAICPGYVNTDMVNTRPELMSALMIQPDDVAQAVQYVLECSNTACPTEIVLRPQRPPFAPS